MHNVKVTRPIRFEPDSGIEQIARASFPASPMPERDQVLPAEGAEPIQLDRLYPAEPLDTFIARRLQPRLLHADLQLPAGFRRALVSTRQRLQLQVVSHPAAARQLGKLSSLLDEHDELCGLARLYYASLLQG